MHRDLKADNVMVGAFGEVQVMDWGLAKLVDAEEGPLPQVRGSQSSAATRIGTIIGTPRSMAPEQALGRAADRRSDIWALGGLLYELLCDKRPFDGSIEEVLDAIRVYRFDGVPALRAEIVAWDMGLPIQSLRYSALSRARLWLGRHRKQVVPATVTAGVAFALLLGGVFQYAKDMAAARDEAMAERDRAVQAETEALHRVLDAELASARAALASDAWLEARTRWTTAAALAKQLGADGREAALGLALAGDDWLFSSADELLFGGAERTLWHRSSKPVESAWLSPDGDRAILVGFEPEVPIIDLQTGEVVSLVASGPTADARWLSPRHVATLAYDGAVRIWELPEHAMGTSKLEGDRPIGGSFDSSGERLLLSGWAGDVWLVEVRTGEVVARLEGPPDGARDAQFSLDGQRALLAGRDGSAWVLDLASGEVLDKHPLDDLLSTVVETEAGLLATGSSGQIFLGETTIDAHDGVIWELERDPTTGRFVTTGRHHDDGRLRLWAADGQSLAVLDLDTAVYRAAITPERMAAGGHVGRVVVADHEGQVLLDFQAHQGPAMAVAMHGDLLATTGYDLSLNLWDIETGHPLLELEAFSESGLDLEFSPDGRWLMAVSGSGELLLFNLERHRSAD